MRLHHIGCTERKLLSMHLRDRFKEAQTFLPKPFFCPINAYFITERYLKSTPLKFYIEGKNNAQPDHGMLPDAHPPPQLNTAFDHTECTNDAIVQHTNGSINACCRMDHGKFHLSVLLLARRRLKGKGIYREAEEEGMKIKTKSNDARLGSVHRSVLE